MDGYWNLAGGFGSMVGIKSGVHCEETVQRPGTKSMFGQRFCKKPVEYLLITNDERGRPMKRGLCQEHGKKVWERVLAEGVPFQGISITHLPSGEVHRRK